jgi:hypothetical protein
LECFDSFRKFAEIFASQGAPPVSTTPVANFATSFADTGDKFVTGVNDTGGKFAAGVNLKSNWNKDCSVLYNYICMGIYASRPCLIRAGISLFCITQCL